VAALNADTQLAGIPTPTLTQRLVLPAERLFASQVRQWHDGNARYLLALTQEYYHTAPSAVSGGTTAVGPLGSSGGGGSNNTTTSGIMNPSITARLSSLFGITAAVTAASADLLHAQVIVLGVGTAPLEQLALSELTWNDLNATTPSSSSMLMLMRCR
jgi:hypothetical protein